MADSQVYSSEKIIWIKNVKRDDGNLWAYDTVTCNETFYLHWPTSKRGSASTPKVGDIIVLFQTPKFINGKKNKKVHFTHLVSPVTPDVYYDERSLKHKWCREVQLIAMPNPIETIPNPGHDNFSLPNRGLTNTIINLENRIGLSEAETQDEIWGFFENFQCPEISTQTFIPKDPIGIYGELEGDTIIVEHIKYEIKRRNSKVVQTAKEEALRNGNGRILCECCGFDFLKFYGSHGYGFIECHHKNHIANGSRKTYVEDLSLVCSNCHRMLHRKNSLKQYYTVEKLQNLLRDLQPEK